MNGLFERFLVVGQSENVTFCGAKYFVMLFIFCDFLMSMTGIIDDPIHIYMSSLV